MGDYVTLTNQEGSFYDPETGQDLSRDDCVPLIEPMGKLTKERLASGALIRCKPPKKATQEPDQETEGQADATPSDLDTTEPDLADIPGQDEGEEVEGAVDTEANADPVEETAPAPSEKKSKKRTSRKKAATK